jgi:hypothetical protein
MGGPPPDNNDDAGAMYPGEDGAVHMIFGRSPARPSRRRDKLIRREVFNAEIVKPSYLKWSEVPITFDRKDHPNHVPQPGSYPLVVAPLFKSKRIHKVLMDREAGSTCSMRQRLTKWASRGASCDRRLHHYSTGSFLEWRHSPSGISICPSRSGICETFATKPSPSKWWGSRGRTMRSSGGRRMRSLC